MLLPEENRQHRRTPNESSGYVVGVTRAKDCQPKLSSLKVKADLFTRNVCRMSYTELRFWFFHFRVEEYGTRSLDQNIVDPDLEMIYTKRKLHRLRTNLGNQWATECLDTVETENSIGRLGVISWKSASFDKVRDG